MNQYFQLPTADYIHGKMVKNSEEIDAAMVILICKALSIFMQPRACPTIPKKKIPQYEISFLGKISTHHFTSMLSTWGHPEVQNQN